MKKNIEVFASSWLMAILLLVFATVIALGTFIESRQSTEIAWALIYNARWFELLLFLGVINLTLSIFTRKLYRKEKLSVFIFHIAFVVILIGAGVTRYFGVDGRMQIREGGSSNIVVVNENEQIKLDFSLHLNDFIIDYYPGSNNPSGFESLVTLVDENRGIHESRRIFMNNILKYRGYRFYQSSYTNDQKGTILSVSRDWAGMSITYFGYILLVLGFIWSLINKNSRFAKLIRQKTALLLVFLFFSIGLTRANASDSIPVIPYEQASNFGELLVRDAQGRTKPLNTLAEDIFRKVHRKDSYRGQSAMQVLLGMFVYPDIWQDASIVYAGRKVSQLIDISDKYVSLNDCYVGKGFFISSMEAVQAYRIPPSQRSKAQNDLIRFDERLNILYQWFGGTMLNIFPNQTDTTTKWNNPVTVFKEIPGADSILIYKVLPVYFSEVRAAMKNGNWQTTKELVDGIKRYQKIYGDNLPSENKVLLEAWYYNAQIFKRVSYLYLILGFTLLITILIKVFNTKVKAFKVQNSLIILIAVGLLVHTIGLGIRWYISGHAPWSNAYETMIFIAWSAVLAGVLFWRRNKFAPAIAAIMAAIYMMVGNMSWMDPQLTNLVPVLKSKWLVIHVAVITSSYGFLGIGSLMAFVNMLLMAFQTKKNYSRIAKYIASLSRIVEMVLTVGVYLLGVGTFLGAVWANVSWGRYWAWDPKETWALITVLVYAIVLHLRLIPKLKSELLFNFMSVIAYASVLMTYFGVNYYLSGLHSYATGDPAPIPKSVYYAVGVITIVTLSALMKNKLLRKGD